jgi:T5SS/PEP-CTERM-associated repeat protein
LIGPIAGTYTVTVAAGETFGIGTVSVNSSTATVEVEGTLTGSALSTFAVKNGVLSVLNAGTVAVGTGGLGLAGPAASSATVTVSGANSYLSDSGAINVGICGSGLLQVMNSGTIELTGASGITTGVSASAAGGTVVVAGVGSVLQFDTATGGFTIGNSGHGTVEALNGGSIVMNGTGGIIIGSAAGADLLEVSGTGAVLNQSTNGARVAVGGVAGSAGTLEVLNGGTMVLDGTRAAIDTLTGLIVAKSGAGTVLVDGIGSSLILGDGAIIGYGGNGTLTVQNHGSVTNTGTSSFTVGFGSLGSGTVNVDGGTLINTNGNFIIGGTNTAGSLVVQGGGSLTTGNGGLALSSINAVGSASASATINGGTWTVNGALHVGEDGGSLLDIKTDGTSSGAVNTGTFGIEIASTKSGGSGTITVENGGTLSGGQLQIATVGTAGALSIAAGGVATVSNATIGSGGAVTLSGGTLSAGGLTQVNGMISGFGTLIAGLTNSGTVTASGGRLIVTGSIAGTGAITIGGASTMEVDSGLGFGQAVTFLTSVSPEALQLNLLTSPTQSFGLANWQGGDELIIGNGVTVLGANWLGGGTLQVNTSGPTYDFTNVTLAGSSTTFTTGANYVELICFARGTRIATPNGEVPVECLALGDTVLTLDGEAEPIVWIGTGRQLLTPGRRSAATPVIVRKDALADNVPCRELRVTKGHSLFIGDALIPVEYLVNHRSIVWDDRADEIEVFHIELARHAVLLADGAPAESYRDDGNRWLFQNANATWHLPPQPPCAPVLTGGALVDAAWQRLLDRAGRPDLPMTDAPDLHLLADGQRLNGRRVGDGRYAFHLPSPPNSVRIASRAAAQDELGQARDPRLLGVALRQIKLWQGRHLKVMEADDPRWSDGVHPFEADNGFRWTDGNALLPAAFFQGVNRACDIELRVACVARYRLSEAQPRTAV